MPEHPSSPAKARDVPLLIGLGPIRSGTTWVHELLFGHSQVATTRMKEVNFFNSHFDDGMGWYEEQFRPTTPATRLRADISPFYMMDPAVCDRIARSVANPILMINLRSPYERVLSWYQKYRQEEHAIGALASDPKVHAEALEIGLTANMLQHYVERFGRDRVILVDYADLRADPIGLAERLQRRLSLDIETPPSVTREVNASVNYRSAHLRRLAHLGGPIVRKLSPDLFYAMKFGPLHDVVFARKRITGPSAEQKLTALGGLRATFEDDISRLEDALGRDLGDWRYEKQVAGLEPAQAPVAAADRPIEIAPVRAPAARPDWTAFPARLALEARALWSLSWDPKVPYRARIASIAAASYLLTPFDVIPNRIPIFGHLDEAAAIPLAVALFLWLSPSKLVDRHRKLVRQPRNSMAA
ncbi:MAG TPA: sulfotransferase domain-containing protein [Aliidongia sp.]|uniref:sulfotransferase domain-containing protein n=1 Tax=Aliidongia sp. TaxID=1914230 RepID=UPI002DDCF23E|nr:sulfotransferase domain-containing protein [Aliidongia sp.]HEV2674495.1 sulfotransferase domain-containing protein [Aliidongia sp.]